jgi:hypothetical protein
VRNASKGEFQTSIMTTSYIEKIIAILYEF